MAQKARYKAQDRDAGGFVALPHSVLDSRAYQGLSAFAKVLLIEIARQLRSDNNGALLCSRAYMAGRGWKSNDMLTKCRDELLAAKLLYQTVMGYRPNKASWYAVTWMALDKLDGLDEGAAQSFVRSAYKIGEPLPGKSTREQLFGKWRASEKTQSLSRPTGQEEAL
jgi:hypothetical protein